MVQVRIGRSRPRFSATEIENETKRHCRLGLVVLKDKSVPDEIISDHTINSGRTPSPVMLYSSKA
jgi:hypothetical protein